MRKHYLLKALLLSLFLHSLSPVYAQTSANVTSGFDLDRIVPRISFCFDLAGAPEARFGLSITRRPVFNFIEHRGWGCNVVVKTTSIAIPDAAGAGFRSHIAETVKSWARAWFETLLGRFIK